MQDSHTALKQPELEQKVELLWIFVLFCFVSKYCP